MIPKLPNGWLLYVNRALLVNISTYINAGKYNKLLPRAYGPSWILQVIKLTLTVDDNGIINIISVHRVTPVARQMIHPCLSNESKTLFGGQSTIPETATKLPHQTSSPSRMTVKMTSIDYDIETTLSFLLYNDSIEKTGRKSSTNIAPKLFWQRHIWLS